MIETAILIQSLCCHDDSDVETKHCSSAIIRGNDKHPSAAVRTPAAATPTAAVMLWQVAAPVKVPPTGENEKTRLDSAGDMKIVFYLLLTICGEFKFVPV